MRMSTIDSYTRMVRGTFQLDYIYDRGFNYSLRSAENGFSVFSYLSFWRIKLFYRDSLIRLLFCRFILIFVKIEKITSNNHIVLRRYKLNA